MLADFTWQYPIVMLLAVGMGGVFFYFLTRVQKTTPKEIKTCTRCKLNAQAKEIKQYLYCPYCGKAYSI